MNTQQEQERRLEQEILSEAQKRADRIVARAEADGQKALRAAEEANARRREEALAEAREEAARKARGIERGSQMERRRLWLEEREACLETCFVEVLREAEELPQGDSRRAASLAALAREAIRAIQADKALAVAVSPTDAALATAKWLEGLCDEARGIAFEVRADESMRGGIRVATPDGARAYDNTYGGRLDRLKEQFRREVAAQGGDLLAEE